MKGGVILFRGTGSAACRYLESDRSRADDYYLEQDTTLATFTVTDGRGEVQVTVELDAESYAGWVNWIDPMMGTSMGTPRLPGEEGTAKHGSPRFAEMVVNAPKSLSVAAALHPDVSDALDAAQADAVNEIRRFLALHSVTRVGPRGGQEVVPVERLQTVAVVHKTSRAGDPHRHVHFQIGTRVWAAGKWRGLDTAALFKQQGAIRALGTAVLAAHPGLADALDRHGLTLDSVTGEVTELEAFNNVMSKRGAQVEKNLAELETAWEEAHPGQEPGPVVHARMIATAWAKNRPQKRPGTLAHEDGWRADLADAGYDPTKLLQRLLPTHSPLGVDDLEIQTIASRALDRCAAATSTWTRHAVQEQITRIVTEHGVCATPAELRELIELTTDLALGDCLSVLPPGTAQPEHVAHLTSLEVIAAETRLRELVTTATEGNGSAGHPDVTALAAGSGLDEAQTEAAGAIASADPLVIVEGAAGAGKTTMLGVAITSAAAEGRATRVVTPTKKAADVAARELGVPAESVAKLLHAHGWRWNVDGVWSRVDPGEPPAWAKLTRGERIVVDEAGMLDQDSAIALLTIAAESGATIGLVGDRAQLPAVGRGGVLDIAATITTGSGGTVHDLDTVHRFADPAYADLTLQMRAGHGPTDLFDQLDAVGLIRLHATAEQAHEQIADATTSALARGRSVAATVATNDEARDLNERIRNQRIASGSVDDTTISTGRDGLPIGVGDVIATRRNDSNLGVANRQIWTVQHVATDGTLTVVDAADARKRQRSVTLPSPYVAEHVHLAYANTGYGVQGVTVTTAHTLLSESLDAAGVYVGMTRGRNVNVLHIVAENLDEARELFIDALGRDRADRGLQVATTDARSAVAVLAADGPVKLVNDERSRLAQLIAQAELQAARWDRASALLRAQAQSHAREEARASSALMQASAHLTAVRNDALAPLLAQATTDGQAYVDADAREHEAWKATQSAGRLGKRGAERRLAAMRVSTSDARVALFDRWGSVPDPGRWGIKTRDSLEPWAERVAVQRADAEPAVIEARRQAQQAEETLQQNRTRHRHEAEDLTIGLNGQRAAVPHQGISGRNRAAGRARRWQRQADELRSYLAHIESLPIERAVQLIETRRTQALEGEQVSAARSKRLEPKPEHPIDRQYPRLGLGR
ncbi:MAG: TrwC relaxase [Nocardioides sp.]|nr:TrwC relaxase [Nocardioides sp.]|tara:strand:+ start:5907 stop:9389 length:3483 start_codon:yes stop_codon:yes gene_type:complete